MEAYKLTESEEKFADIIWQNEPISSTDLVKLCEKEMDWKNSYYSRQSIRFVEDTFGGSLPKFLTAFISGKKISKHQAEELKRLIDEHRVV